MELTSQLNQWIAIPPAEGLLYAEIEMRLLWPGRVLKTVFRVPQVLIDLEYESGRSESYRFLPSTARGAILISHVPRDLSDLERLFSGFTGERVSRFRIHGPGAAYYARSFTVRWAAESS